jgi:hypothetical protein
VWRAKEKADEVEVASVNMFILPTEFKALSDDDAEHAMVQLSLDPVPAIYDKP